MSKNCGKCVKGIRGIEYAKCSGFCDQLFHFACCGITRPTYELISASALWLCAECRSTLNNRCLKDLLTGSEDITLSLKQELEEIKCRLAAISDAIDVSAADTQSKLQQFGISLSETKNNVAAVVNKTHATVCEVSNVPPNPSKRRRVDDNTDRDFASVAQGTGDIDFDGISAPMLIPAAPPALFWLYLSGFHPQVTTEDVEKIIGRCLPIDEPVRTNKLVPKDADISKLTFVSFKVGLPPMVKDAALLPATWPKGIRFREFEDHSSKNQQHQFNHL